MPDEASTQTTPPEVSHSQKGAGSDEHGPSEHAAKVAASPTMPDEASTQTTAPEVSHPKADGTGAGAPPDVVTAAHLAHPATSYESAEPTGSSSPAQLGGTTPPLTSPMTAGAPVSQPTHVADSKAQPGFMHAEIGPDGNLVFTSSNSPSSPPVPTHVPHDPDVHTEVGLVGISHDHALVHHLDFH